MSSACRECSRSSSPEAPCYLGAVTDPVQRFAALYSFPLDDYQIAGCEALASGSGVLVLSLIHISEPTRPY